MRDQVPVAQTGAEDKVKMKNGVLPDELNKLMAHMQGEQANARDGTETSETPPDEDDGADPSVPRVAHATDEDGDNTDGLPGRVAVDVDVNE